jgi:hypothetical protein
MPNMEKKNFSTFTGLESGIPKKKLGWGGRGKGAS